MRFPEPSSARTGYKSTPRKRSGGRGKSKTSPMGTCLICRARKNQSCTLWKMSLLSMNPSSISQSKFLSSPCRSRPHNTESFASVLLNVGLGIGIDYGEIQPVSLWKLTGVGTPVVYACRFGSALAGDTLLNQPAYEIINERFRSYCTITETKVTVKNEGDFLAYKVVSNQNTYTPKPPPWLDAGNAEKIASPP